MFRGVSSVIRTFSFGLGAAIAVCSLSLPAVAQTSEANQIPRSYIGIGGNLGISGEASSLGEGGFSIVSKTRIINSLALRNSTIFGDETASIFALTGELPLTNAAGDVVAIPFVGAGIWLHDEVDPVVSAGVDVPLGRNFTVTNRVNLGFDSDDTDIGLLIGVGYNFDLF